MKIQAIRGMNDILPDAMPMWHYLETQLRAVLDNFGYSEIRFPIVEKTELFKRSIGEVTDIVGKEMYTFLDNEKNSLTLRPEGTACCVRAAAEHELLHHKSQPLVQKLWYMGQMFRHERPQKGRYRQFYQLGVEAFGLPGPDIDAELILMTMHFWRRLGLVEQLTLHLNSLGTLDERQNYRGILVEYLEAHREQLDEDSLKRLTTNPLRVLDSKNPKMQTMIAQAPSLLEHLGAETLEHFQHLQALLDVAGINYEINPHLVRGLDYYSHTVFEWRTAQLGSQDTVCAGGRYDGLVEMLSGKASPAVGFAMGMERILLLLEQQELHVPRNTPDAYMIVVGQEAELAAMKLQEQIRTTSPDFALTVHCGGGSFKSQFKKADKSGARMAFILGDEEVKNEQVAIKYLREDKPQALVSNVELIKTLMI